MATTKIHVTLTISGEVDVDPEDYGADSIEEISIEELKDLLDEEGFSIDKHEVKLVT